jgi:hypothetical protein
MKRRILGFCLALAMILATCGITASAAVLTDAPATPTQDRVVSLEATWDDSEKTPYDLQALPADKLAVDNTTDVFEYVYEQQHRPARWYPRVTQKAIEKMVSVDIDALYMTEFMRLSAPEIDPPADLNAVMTLTIDYQPGQLTVVVLGDESDPNHIVWTPVESRVTDVGRVEFDIPQSLMKQLEGEELLFSLLTVRDGTGGTASVQVTEAPSSLPSKQASDTIRIITTTGQDGQAKQDDFLLKIVPETNVIQWEIKLMRNFLKTEPAEEHTAIKWMPTEDQNRIKYLLNSEGDKLIVSDYLPIVSEDFRQTDGDAVGTLSFATPYKEGQVIITALGIPKPDLDLSTIDETWDETLMVWSVQPAVVRKNGVVDIAFDQMALIDMGDQTGLLLVLSEPTTAN